MSTTETTAQSAVPLPPQRIVISVTEGPPESVPLRVLVRQAIPMLENPEGHSPAARLQLAETLTHALGNFSLPQDNPDFDHVFTDAEVPPDEDEEDTGCCCDKRCVR